MAYLDHAATTPMLDEALEAYVATAREVGNPSSLHAAGRSARRHVEEARERIAAALGARPSEVIFTGGGTESDNLAVKGIFWARRARRPARGAGSWPARSSTTPCSTRSTGWPGTRAPTVDLAAGRRRRAGSTRRPCARRSPRTADEVALVTAMWANNEVGTVQPVAELAALAAAHGVPFHTDAVQAVGQVPVDFAASGVAALTVTGHKLGGPVGVGALLLGPRRRLHPAAARRRPGARRPLRHARRRRASSRSPSPSRRRSRASRSTPPGSARCATTWSPGCARRCRTRSQRRPGRPAAGQRALLVPRLRGRRAAAAAGRPGHRLLDRLGLLGRGGPAVARAAGDGRRRRPGPVLAAVHPRPHLDRGRRRRAGRRAAGRGRAGPPGRRGQAADGERSRRRGGPGTARDGA